MKTFLKTCVGGFALAALSTPALAQTGPGPFKVSESQNETYASVGVAAVTRETYVGSGESDVMVLPFINAVYKGRYYINPALGAGVYLINNDKFRVATGVGVALGRSAKDVPLLGTVGKVDTSLMANAAARYTLPFAALDVIGQVPITGDLKGSRFDVLLTTQFSPFDNLRITPGVRATYHSSDWLNTIYGIDSAQSLASTQAPLNFGGEFSTFGVHTAAYLKLSETMEIVGAVNYSRLVGDVKDSPLANSNNGLTAAIGIARKF